MDLPLAWKDAFVQLVGPTLHEAVAQALWYLCVSWQALFRICRMFAKQRRHGRARTQRS
jgi:hypothetical protein